MAKMTHLVKMSLTGNMQMMHGIEWTLKYDEPRKMSHKGAARVRHFQPRVIMFQCRTNDRASCFVTWPTTSLKLYIVFRDGGETRVSSAI